MKDVTVGRRDGLDVVVVVLHSNGKEVERAEEKSRLKVVVGGKQSFFMLIGNGREETSHNGTDLVSSTKTDDDDCGGRNQKGKKPREGLKDSSDILQRDSFANLRYLFIKGNPHLHESTIECQRVARMLITVATHLVTDFNSTVRNFANQPFFNNLSSSIHNF
ncbi:CLUMA_CG010491, isoform A [Clunio marinus]|uniref:CLUMA_CG010491, isoform A n=1 Tax=Clunio marinus TaxID=568069 RepID=A0A1J1I9Y6_9DIPT|nr:CLUMA_CG010491, isoform A [Clunio marinus]